MPDVSQAEIGRRMYHVHRGKQVERAVKLIQEAAGAEWRALPGEEIHLLGHLLQCAWNTIDQKRWETIPFHKADMDIVRNVLSLGEGVGPGRNPSPEAVASIKAILLGLK